MYTTKLDWSDHFWIAADYYFATSYSCSIPMSSQHSALALPAPGPATVRLALIRNGIELFGGLYVRDILFPVIRTADICIRPPEYVAWSNQLLKLYKTSITEPSGEIALRESLAYRETAHAHGPMTLYLKIPQPLYATFKEILQAIGYWGHADSLASCLKLEVSEPNYNECATPLNVILETGKPVNNYYSSLVTEFKDNQVEWNEVMPTLHDITKRVLRNEIFVWPLINAENSGAGRRMLRKSFDLDI